ncbi:MAG: thioredoxin family protein [Myxococcales bacterium]|nr:thioredoxin family protein [Myxococcales bacterium]
MMEELHTLEQAEQAVREHQGVLLYFSSEDCSVCKVLKPKVIHAIEADYPEMKLYFVDIQATPRISAHYSIYTLPAIIVFLEGKEFIRKARSFSPAELVQELQRPWQLMTENEEPHP